MKVLAFSAYYTPEVASSLYLNEDLYEGITERGNTIELFVPMPTRGVSREVRDGYKKNKTQKKYDGRLVIHRISMYREKNNSVLRAIRYLLVNIAFIWKGLTTGADAVFVQSTPPTQGMMAGIISSLKKIPFIYNLQDIFPDSLVNAGMTHRGSLLWKIGRKIENYTYSRAAKIIVISEGFKRNIMAKGVPEEKIEIIPNWIDTEKVKPVPKEENRLYDELGIDKDKFTVVYAGNFGSSQGADIVIKAAEKLRVEKDIQFAVFGGGSEFEAAREYALSCSLDNLKMFDLMPPERVSEVYSLGDVALITCKKGIGSSGLPSKTWSIMACDTPIIASFDTDSDLARVLELSGAGSCVAPEDPAALAKEILRAGKSADIRRGGREYVSQFASKDVCVGKYAEIIEKCVNGREYSYSI